MVRLEKVGRNLAGSAVPARRRGMIGLGRLNTENWGDLDYVVEEFVGGSV